MVLVDSSTWIEYFKGNEHTVSLNDLIDSNNICVNDLILAELLPSIVQKNEKELQALLLHIHNMELDIDWDRITTMQIINLKNGINKVGISDLIIAQNAIDNNLELFTMDKHFSLMGKLHSLRLYKA